MMTSTQQDDAKQRAESLKNAANQCFQAAKYADADKLYSQAIDLDPSVPAFWTNRSLTNIKLENYGYAIRDANAAIELDPGFIKAYYRRASAFLALSRLKEAVADFRTVTKYVPSDPDAKRKLAEVEKMIRVRAFEAAMAYEQKSAEEKIQLDQIYVDQDYDGMRWEDETPLSLEFVQNMMDRFENQLKIHRKYAYRILLQAKQQFQSEASLVDIRVPSDLLTICGDVHGQYYDLLNIFRKNGFPSQTHGYLFNGDFVDRGSFSAEVILVLLAYKCLYPNQFFMTRGNHETIDMNKVYGFEGEVKSKYSELMFELFTEVFNVLPLAHVIEKRVMVMHGGLFSKDNVTLQDIAKVDRFRQPPGGDSIMTEILWSDPQAEMGRAASKRGVALQFGPDVTERFCKLNNLDMIVRSHEVKEEGYVIEHNGRCVTVFSAPNYCDQVGNKGAYINVTKRNKADQGDRPELNYAYQIFEAVPHPNVKAMAYAGNMGMFGL